MPGKIYKMKILYYTMGIEKDYVVSKGNYGKAAAGVGATKPKGFPGLS